MVSGLSFFILTKYTKYRPEGWVIYLVEVSQILPMTTIKECEPSLSTDIDIIFYDKSKQDGFRWIVLLIVCICVQ